MTVESDKATMEIPAPYAGKVGKILVSEGDKLSEGDDLLEMTVEEEGGESGDQAEAEPAKEAKKDEARRSSPSRRKLLLSPRVLLTSRPRRAPRSMLARPCVSWPVNWAPI